MFEIQPSLFSVRWLNGLFDRRQDKLPCGATLSSSRFVQFAM
jgi:hypothetical protein